MPKSDDGYDDKRAVPVATNLRFAGSASANAVVNSPRIVLSATAPKPESFQVRFERHVLVTSEQLDHQRIRTILGGKPWAGRRNEDWAIKALKQAFTRAFGSEFIVRPGDDARGVDRVLRAVGCGYGFDIQITAAQSDKGRWEELARTGTVALIESVDEIAANTITSIRNKVNATATGDRQCIVLALDAQQTPAVAHTSVRDRLEILIYENAGFDYLQIWLIGPTVERTVRLFQSSTHNTSALGGHC